jgi:hypothetical protein
MFSVVSATASLVSGDAYVFRIDLVAGPTVDATLTLASAPSGGTTRGVMAAKAGDMRTLEFAESNQLQKTLTHLTIAGTGAKAVVQYEPA